MLAARELAVAESSAASIQRRIARSRVPRSQSARLSRTACFGLLVLAVLCAFFVAYRHTALTQMGYQAEELAQELAVLQKENGERAVRVAQLGSLARVEQLATAQVGMVRPDQSVTIFSLGRSGGTVVAEGGGSSFGVAATGSEVPAEGGLLGRVWSFLRRLARNTVEAARSGS